MVNSEDKENFRITKDDIIEKLKNSEYKERYKVYDTYLGQDADRWRRGYKSKYQQALVHDKLMYFAYIKFYVDNGEKYALVAGKSGSYNVNKSSGCDLGFYVYPEKGPAKKWLYDNKKQWCQTEFLVISTNADEKDKSCKEAEIIEKYLMNTFGLFES